MNHCVHHRPISRPGNRLTLIAILLLITGPTPGAPATNHQQVPDDLESTLQANHEPSLEMKENVDFLAVPACFVQQALRGNPVVFHPRLCDQYQ